MSVHLTLGSSAPGLVSALRFFSAMPQGCGRKRGRGTRPSKRCEVTRDGRHRHRNMLIIENPENENQMSELKEISSLGRFSFTILWILIHNARLLLAGPGLLPVPWLKNITAYYACQPQPLHDTYISGMALYWSLYVSSFIRSATSSACCERLRQNSATKSFFKNCQAFI